MTVNCLHSTHRTRGQDPTDLEYSNTKAPYDVAEFTADLLTIRAASTRGAERGNDADSSTRDILTKCGM